MQCCYSEKQTLVLTKLDGEHVKKRMLFYVSLHSVKSELILTSVAQRISNRLGYLNATSFYSVEVENTRQHQMLNLE